MMLTREQLADALRNAFDGECRELGLDARIEIQGERVTPSFAGQFGAEPDWLASTLLDELRTHGVASKETWSLVPVDDADLTSLLEGVRMALRRTRARLVDTDSWNCGGLEWPFPVVDPVLRERGVALYRAPALSAATVTLSEGHVSIAFPAGDSGEVSSAGFWVPTALEGDFDVDVRYELPTWDPGEREACLGLFAVATDGTFRMYAQRVTRAGVRATVIADLDGTPGPTVCEPSSARGVLRLSRERGLLSAWHRAGTDWTWLGRVREVEPRSLLVGAKVWAVGVSGPLQAELDAFHLDARAALEQIDLPPSRPDPRQAS